MDKKELPIEYLPASYRTGDVQPPKSHQGIITLLLLLVIFLGCLVSALSFANIHLFQLLQGQEDASVRFIPDMRLSQIAEPVTQAGLGVEGYFLSDFQRHCFGLPQGIYITNAHDSPTGIRTGDILLSVNGSRLTDPGELTALLVNYAPGASLSLDIYRGGARQTLTVVLDKTQ